MEESIISPNYVIIVGNAGYIEKVEIEGENAQRCNSFSSYNLIPVVVG